MSNIFKDKKLSVLVKMQLKDKWNISNNVSKKTLAFKILTRVIIFIALCAVSFLVLDILCNKLHLFATKTVPVSAMALLISILTLFEGISILIGLTNALYFGKDNSVLITYPVNADYLFTSKMIVYYLDAIKKSFSFIIPILIGFGILSAFSFYYYLWIILIVIIYMGVIVSLCALLSIPCYFITRFLEKNRIVKLIAALVLLLAVIYVSILLINIIPENINLIKTFETFSKNLDGFLSWYSHHFVIMNSITKAMCGVQKGLTIKIFSKFSYIVPLAMIFSIACLIVIDMFVSKPFYTKMISNSNSFKKKNHKASINIHREKFYSIFKYESLRILRDEKYLISSIVTIIITPLIMLLVNKFYGSFKTQIRGDQFITLFNLLFIMILVMSHNITSSYIYSKDGPSWNINKTIPVDPRKSLTGRLFYNLFVSILVIIPGSIIFLLSNKISISEGIFFVLTIITLSSFHSLLSASFDFMHSKEKTKADIGSEIVHSHETISLIFSLIIALATFGVAFIMYYTTTDYVFLRIFIMSILVLSLEVYLFFKRIRATYQEN